MDNLTAADLNEVMETLRAASAALATLHPNSLGMAQDDASQWPIRDELISRIDGAILLLPEQHQKAVREFGFIKPDTAKQVFFYEQDFYVLSNFSAFNLQWKGRMFATSEAAYHWEKFPDRDALRSHIISAPSAHVAFKLAEDHKDQRREDWNEVRVTIMREILMAKAMQHEYVRRKLLATGDRELVEDSWRDSFWGWGPNRDGRNMLGNLWMNVRDELRLKALAEQRTDQGITASVQRATPSVAI